MSAEYVAELLADFIDGREDGAIFDDPLEDVRSGGVFFEASVKGKHYEVLVTQLREVTR